MQASGVAAELSGRRQQAAVELAASRRAATRATWRWSGPSSASASPTRKRPKGSPVDGRRLAFDRTGVDRDRVPARAQRG